MLEKLFLALCRIPGLEKKLWHGWYQYLARHHRSRDWTFMNYGFVAPHSQLNLEPDDEPHRACIALYNHVAGAVPLAGCRVLEVGSGLGGGASFIARYLQPASMTGLDLSEEAIRFCRETHRVRDLMFQTGDAERLPFETGTFDAVVNVESSHCYPHLSSFFAEVARVLRPGGHFLYADFRSRDAVDAWRHTLSESGLVIVTETDITANVLAALDVEDERKLAIIDRDVPNILRSAVSNFAAVRGSKMYDAFRSGSLAYLSFVAQKSRGERM